MHIIQGNLSVFLALYFSVLASVFCGDKSVSVSLFVSLPVCSYVHLSIRLSLDLTVCSFVFLCVCMHTCVCPSVCVQSVIVATSARRLSRLRPLYC